MPKEEAPSTEAQADSGKEERPPYCPICGREKKRLPNLHPGYARRIRICPRCRVVLQAMRGVCPTCPEWRRDERTLFYRLPTNKEIAICETCFDKFNSPVGNCPICNNERHLSKPHPKPDEATRVCDSCYRYYYRGICQECPKGEQIEKPLPFWYPGDHDKGRVCQRCYRRLKRVLAICPLCPGDKKIPRLLNRWVGKGNKKKRVCLRCFERQWRLGIVKGVRCLGCNRRKRKLKYPHPQFRGLKICSACKRRTTNVGLCSLCGLWKPRPHRDPANRENPICDCCWGKQYRKKKGDQKGLCGECGKEKRFVRHKHPEHAGLLVCPKCWRKVAPAGRCNQCRKNKPLTHNNKRNPDKMICYGCYQKQYKRRTVNRHKGVCLECTGKRKGIVRPRPHRHPKLPDERICPACYKRLTRMGTCNRCKETERIVPYTDPTDAKERICNTCHWRESEQKKRESLAVGCG